MPGPTNFPAGLTSYGVPLPSAGNIPVTGGNYFWVGNRSGLASGDGSSPRYPFSTLNGALLKGTASANDVFIVMPGHVETFTGASGLSNLVAGSKIVGLGMGLDRPTFHWSTATSTVLINKANVSVDNCNLNLAGDPTLTTAITGSATGSMIVSAPGFRLTNSNVNVGVDADQITTIGVAFTDAADFAVIDSNNFWSGILTAAGVYTEGITAEIVATGTVLRLVGADFIRITNNRFQAALATDTDGLIETLTTASTNIVLNDNFFYANGAGNTCAVDFGAALACTGELRRNLMAVDADGTAQTVVFTVHANNNLALMDNNMVTNNNERGLAIGTATT